MLIKIFAPENNQLIAEFEISEDTRMVDIKDKIQADFVLQIEIPGSDAHVLLNSHISDDVNLLDYIYYHSHYAPLHNVIQGYLIPHSVDLRDAKHFDEKHIHQVFKKKPPDYFHYFTPEAFVIPEDKPKLGNDYKQLYHSIPYISYPKHLMDKKSECEAFEKQLFEVVDKIVKWGNTNGVDINQERQNNIMLFKDQFFNHEYSGKQSPIYFEAIKKHLESIWFQLNHSGLSLDLRRMECEDLVDSLGVCNAGIYTHIEAIYYCLHQDNSLQRILADYRTEIIKQFGAKLIGKNQIEQANSIHVHNAFLKYAINEKWNPLISTDDLSDDYIQGLITQGYFSETDLSDFHKFFVSQYTPENIIKLLSNRYKNDINKIRLELGMKEDKNGWIKCDRDYHLYMNRIEGYFRSAGMKTDNIFTLNEDFTAMRVDNELLYQMVFQFCLQNKLFIPDAFCFKSTIYAYADYLPEKNNEMKERQRDWSTVDYAKIPEFLAAIINKTPKEACSELIKSLETKPWFDKLCKDDKLINVFLNIEDFEKCQIIANTSQLSKAKLFGDYSLFRKLLDKFSMDDWLTLLKNTFLKNLPVKYTYNKLLNLAIKNDDFELMKRLISEFKIDVESVDEKGYTALQTAIVFRKHAIMNYLINSVKVNVNKESKQGLALSIAVKQGDLQTVKYLFTTNADIHGDEKNSQKLLLMACNNDLSILKYLLEEKQLNIEMNNVKVDAILHEVISNGKCDVIKYLIQEQHMDKNTANSSKSTLLHLACSFGHHEIVQYLIAQRVELDRQDLDGETPLHIAAQSDPDLVKMLIDAGANVNIKNNEGSTPLVTAKLNRLELSDFDDATKQVNAEIIQLLKQAESPILSAVSKGTLFDKTSTPMLIEQQNNLKRKVF